jgi:hypothetical protein
MAPVRLTMIACLALVMAASAASAQTSLDAEIARGVALRRDGRDEAALGVFRAAWESSRAPRALTQVAFAEQALGRWVDAEAHLIEALGTGRDPWVHAHLAILQAALGEIRQHVGRLDVVGSPTGAEVVIDGAVVGALPLPSTLHVATGSLTFTVRRQGYIPVTRTVQVESRFPLREQVALARVAQSSPALSPARSSSDERLTDPVLPRAEPRSPTLRYVGYALVGTGVAALAVSGAFLGVNLVAAGEAGSATPASADPYGAWARFQASENATQSRTASGQCDLAQQRGGADAAQVRDLCARMSTTATVALAAGLTGGALLVTGVIFTVVGRSRGDATAARWSLAPWIAANANGASLTTSW